MPGPIYSKAENVAGNASLETKEYVLWILSLFMNEGTGFADSIGGRVDITEISVVPKANSRRLEAKVVAELKVTQGQILDMVNGGGNLHGGCSAYLVDICSSLPIAALTKVNGLSGIPPVSQAINMLYHAPTTKGAMLRIISTSITFGARTQSARCEIWDKDRDLLVASGTHIKMAPTQKL